MWDGGEVPWKWKILEPSPVSRSEQGCVGRSTKVGRGQEGEWHTSHCAGGRGLVPGAGGQGEVPCLWKGFREPCWPQG